MVKPHHMMLGKRRHGHVFRILYVLRRKSIFQPNYSIFRRRRRWSSTTTRCSIDGDTRALKLPFKICTMVWDCFWKHENSLIVFSLFSYVFQFYKCKNLQKYLQLFGWGCGWGITNSNHCALVPKVLQAWEVIPKFFWVCFLFGLLID